MRLDDYPKKIIVSFEPEEAEALAALVPIYDEAEDALEAGRALERVRKALAVEKGPGGFLAIEPHDDQAERDSLQAEVERLRAGLRLIAETDWSEPPADMPDEIARFVLYPEGTEG